MIDSKPVTLFLFGGSGNRLWAFTRNGFPRQFLCFTEKEILFQQDVLCLANLHNTDIQVATPITFSFKDTYGRAQL